MMQLMPTITSVGYFHDRRSAFLDGIQKSGQPYMHWVWARKRFRILIMNMNNSLPGLRKILPDSLEKVKSKIRKRENHAVAWQTYATLRTK